MKLHQFYKEFDGLHKDDRFAFVELSPEPTSLFVIYQQLTQVRAQKKFFEDRERQLLKQATLGFEQVKNKRNPPNPNDL